MKLKSGEGGQKGMVYGIYGNREGILKLEFFCSSRDKPEGFGLLGEERKKRRSTGILLGLLTGMVCGE